MNRISTTFALLSFTSLAFLTSACAHHRDVRPSADGVHWVELKTESEEEGARDAISQANNFCEERGKTAAVVSENKSYKGDMDESNYKTLKKAAKAAQTVGGVTYGLGASTESNIGGMVGLGGTVANQIAGEGYLVKMRFKCI